MFAFSQPAVPRPHIIVTPSTPALAVALAAQDQEEPADVSGRMPADSLYSDEKPTLRLGHSRTISELALDPEAHTYSSRDVVKQRQRRRIVNVMAAFVTLLLVSICFTSSSFEESRPQALKHSAAFWDDSTWHSIVDKLHHHPEPTAEAATLDARGLRRRSLDWVKRSFASSISTFAHFDHESAEARDVNVVPATTTAATTAAEKKPLPLMRFGLATLVDEGEVTSPVALRKRHQAAKRAASPPVHVVSAAEVQRQLMKEAKDRLNVRRQARMKERTM